MTEAEKRKHRRFSLAVPIQVRVKTSPQVQTATKDISARGLYFSLSEGCELGSELECVVTLPPELCQGNTIRMRCRGKIVRVEPPDIQNKIGVAASIDTYEFLSA